MKTNNLDNFERLIREKLESEVAPYNPSDWNDLNKRLDALTPKPFYKSSWFIGGSAALVLVAGTIGLVSIDADSHEVASIESHKINNTTEVIQKAEDKEGLKSIGNIQQEEDVKVSFNKQEDNSLANQKRIKKTQDKAESETHINEGESSITEQNQPTETTSDSPSFIAANEQINSAKESEQNFDVEKPIAEFKVKSNTSGCEGLNVQFEAKEQPKVNYLWSFGDGNYSNERTPQHTYNQSGVYNVELIVQSTVDKSVLSKYAQENLITVHDTPEVTIEKDVELEGGLTKVFYSVTGGDYATIVWNFENGQQSKETEVTYVYKKKGNHSVTLDIESPEGCKNKMVDNVYVEEDYNLLAPNTFSPNGDGLNDEFIPLALKDMNVPFTLIIQDRRGNVVFKTSDVNKAWDGTNMNTGEQAPETNYLWFVRLVNEEGQPEQYSGEILIKRN